MSDTSDFLKWSFDPVVSDNSAGLSIPSLTIDECELCILWTLGEKGKKSIYDLGYKEKYYLPKQVKSFVSTEIPAKKAGGREPYQYPFVSKTVRQLAKKNLVRITKDSTGDRIKKMVTLTFSGLSLYLRGSDDKNRFKNAINNHPDLIVCARQWHTMREQIGENRCLEALEKTINCCINVLKAKFYIRLPKLEFDGYLNQHYPSYREREVLLERDMKTSEYLKTKEALVLRNSYISYLAVHDMFELSKKNAGQVKKLLQTLESEKELAYFEKRKTNQTSLFKGERLKEFFPKYASIEYFFTGMFVETLLWNEKPAEKESRFCVKIY
jgi:hypothetical protein